jgi:hypothetical protein
VNEIVRPFEFGCELMNVDNPHAPSTAKPLGGETIRKALRTKATCYLIGVSFSMFIVCTFLHVCMCGHLAHATETNYPFHVALDAVLGLLLLSVPILAVGSHFRFGPLLVVPLSAIYVDHVLLASGGGFLFLLLDLPVMISIAVLAFRRFRESNRALKLDRANKELQPSGGSAVS